MARLALIADHLEVPDARQQALNTMITALTPWLLGGIITYTYTVLTAYETIPNITDNL